MAPARRLHACNAERRRRLMPAAIRALFGQGNREKLLAGVVPLVAIGEDHDNEQAADFLNCPGSPSGHPRECNSSANSIADLHLAVPDARVAVPVRRSRSQATNILYDIYLSALGTSLPLLRGNFEESSHRSSFSYPDSAGVQKASQLTFN